MTAAAPEVVRDTRHSLNKELFGLVVVPVESHNFSLDLRFSPTAKALGCKKVSYYLQQETGEELWQMVRCRI